jgi:hypothetical protein
VFHKNTKVFLVIVDRIDNLLLAELVCADLNGLFDFAR